MRSIDPQYLAQLAKAGREMEEAARLEGIDDHGPLGRWIKTVRMAMDTQVAVSMAAAESIERSVENSQEIIEAGNRAHQAVGALALEAKKVLDGIKARAEARIKEDEETRDAFYKAAANRMLEDILKQVAPAVLDKIKERVPFVEQGFYEYARNRFFMRLVLVGAGIFALSFLSGVGFYWRSIEVGNHCLDRSNVSYADTGKAWCRLPEDDKLPASPVNGS
ncbi:hypothetical protein [Asaia bogorensis]|uniref:hypothetical protein n=1 Tax=Asaia bogorensis TaxID=91915 RepID=UPI00301B21BC